MYLKDVVVVCMLYCDYGDNVVGGYICECCLVVLGLRDGFFFRVLERFLDFLLGCLGMNGFWCGVIDLDYCLVGVGLVGRGILSIILGVECGMCVFRLFVIFFVKVKLGLLGFV